MSAGESINAALDRACEAWRAGQIPFARQLAAAALTWGPSVDAYCLLGELSFELDEFEDAARWYDAACVETRVASADTLMQAHVVERFARRRALRRYMMPYRSVLYDMMDPNHVLALMTCVGREERMERVLDALARSTTPSAHLIVRDGATGICDVGGNLRSFLFDGARAVGQPAGHARAFHRLLERVVTSFPDFTAVTVLEDDIALAPNALEYITSTIVDDDLALISWCTLTQNLPSNPPLAPYLHVMKAMHYYPSNQCVTLPARTVHAVLESKALEQWPEKHGGDRVFWAIPGKPCAVHYPNLVQHEGGLDSLTGNTGERKSVAYSDTDALELRRR